MTEFTNRLAVSAIERQALRLGWFFRPQDISDQGIDAHVEKVDVIERPGKRAEEVGTGRLIALQIKGGPSYFENESPGGWWFYFSAKKATLWLNHALPVLVVLVDVERDAIYWQRISSATVQSTGKNFKVEVPRRQDMHSADAEWTHIASGLEARSEAQYEYVVAQLPPSVKRSLAQRSASDQPDAALLAVHLAEGRANPQGTVESLLAVSPVWMQRNASWAWSVLASYAAEHGCYELSAEAFERAGRANDERRGALLAAAALNIMQTDRPRSVALLAEAAEAGGAASLVAIGRSLLDHPENDAGPRDVPEMLLTPSEENLKSAAVQGFLADQARRAGDLDRAVDHCQAMLEAEPDNASAMMQCAEVLLRRWNATGGSADDMTRAVKLLSEAIAQRREWAGPTHDLIVELAHGYALDGRFDQMLNLCLARPRGTATPDEAADAKIQRYALLAADLAEHPSLVEELAAALGDSVGDRLLKMRLGKIRPSLSEAQELWSIELKRAVEAKDYSQIAEAGVSLAKLGVDVRPTLQEYIEQSIIPASVARLAEALLLAKTDLNAALPIFRELSRSDVIAAEQMIQQLRLARRFKDAAAACEVLYATGGNPIFLIQQAQCLIDAEDESAESIAVAAVGASSGHLVERGRLLTFLGGRAAERDEWEVAERYLTEVLNLFTAPGAGEVWRVVISQLNQGKLLRAAATVGKYRPEVRSKEEAELWLHANTAVVWDEAKASEALTLARRFKDPKLSIALLGRIITGTHGGSDPLEASSSEDEQGLGKRRQLAQAVVSPELHRDAFAVLQHLVAEYGDATGVRVLEGEPETLLAQMTELLQDAANAELELGGLLESARQAQLPLGFIAGLRGHSYAALLVQRAMGVLIAASADDDEHDHEVEVAKEALGRSVVVDAAAMLTLSGLEAHSSLSGQFLSLITAAESMRDVHRAGFDVRGLAGSPGWMSWDPGDASLVFTELGDEEYVRQLRRTERLEDYASRILVRVVRDPRILADLNDRRHSSWVHAVELAGAEGLALWTDDLGLRRLARSVQIPAFGTPAVIEAVRNSRIEAAVSESAVDDAIDTAVTDLLRLAEDRCVDLALDRDSLLTLAERDGWTPGSAGAVMARPAWWVWQKHPIQDLLALYERVRDENAKALSSWQLVAMFGVARAADSVDSAAKLLALTALLAFSVEPEDSDIISGVRQSRTVATRLGIPDPVLQLSSAAVDLSRQGLCADPQGLVERILHQIDDEESTSPDALPE